MFEILPSEIQLKIMSYLYIQHWPNLLLVNKNFYQHVHKFFLSSNIFEEQFPHKFNTLKTQPHINLYSKFFKIYKKAVQGLDPKLRLIFDYARKGDCEAFKRFNFPLKIFFIYQDIHGRSLLHWMRRNQRQDLLDFIFNHYLSEIHSLRKLPEKFFDVFRISKISANLDYHYWCATCYQKNILEKNILMNNYNLFCFAMKSGNIEIIHLMHQQHPKLSQYMNYELENLLYVATESGNIELIKWLFKSNLVNENTSLALNLAALRGNREIIKIFIKYKILESKFSSKNPLYWAAKEGHLEMVKLLLKAGENPYKRNLNNNQTPLEAARKENHLKIKFLLELIFYRDQRQQSQNYSRLITFFKDVSIPWIQKELSFDKGTDVAAANALIDVILRKAPSSLLLSHQAALQHGTLAQLYQNLISEIPGGDLLKIQTTLNYE